MWGKRYNHGGEHGKHWYIWVLCAAANLFCLCAVTEVSRMCHGWQVRESIEAVTFPVLSLKSRQTKPYLPQRITFLCIGILQRVSASGAICVAFPAKPGKLPQEHRTGVLGRSCGRASEDGFSLLWEGQAERPAVRLPHPPTPKGCFGRQPVPASAQSPHRLKRPA